MTHLMPEVFGRDLFFAYGSQDDYTVFGRAYAAAVSSSSLTHAARVLWGAAQVLWFLVAVAWIGRAVAREHLLTVAACVFALPGFYGSDAVFRSAESFLTARSYAEPIALGAILLVALGRRRVGFAALAGAMLIHPIIGLPAVLVVGLLEAPRVLENGRRIAIAVTLGTMVAIAILYLSGEFRRVDDQWYSILWTRSPYLMPDRWRPVDWISTLFPILSLAVVARRSEPPWARIWNAFAACAGFGLALSVVASGLRWELGLQAQFWRFAWLACWAAPLAALQLAVSGTLGTAQRIVLYATIPALALTSQEWWPLGWLLPLICLLFLAAALWGSDREGRVGRPVTFAMAALVGAAALIGGVLTVVAMKFYSGSTGYAQDTSFSMAVVTYLGWAALPCAVWVASCFSGNWKPGARSGLVAAVLATIAVVGLDGRSARAVVLDRLIDDGLPAWTAAIPPESSVLWPSHLSHVWFGLTRQSYVSREQLSGVVFGRSVSVEGVRRMEEVRPIAGIDGALEFRLRVDAAPVAKETLDNLARVCASASKLDFVVSTVAPVRPMVAPYIDTETAQVFHLHRCADLRAP